MTRPSLRARIRDAWHILTGRTDFTALFASGMEVGECMAYAMWQKHDVVLDPRARSRDRLTGAVR